MKATPLGIKDVLLIEPTVFHDERGFFYESFNQREFNQLVSRTVNFVQDNHSSSKQNILRGLHYQIKQPQAKLVRAVKGAAFDVAVDLRKTSSTFGKWVGEILSEENKRQIWIPEGFAHGFVVLSEYAEILYKSTAYWAPQYERCILWNDPILNIDWPTTEFPRLSEKDNLGQMFADAEFFSEPPF